MGSTRELSQVDFSGGMNVVTSPWTIKQTQVSRLRNMILDEHGALRTRDGYTVVDTSPDTSSPIIYHGGLTLVNGTNYHFSIQSNGTTQTLYDMTTNPWTTVGTTTSSYMTPQSVTVVDKEMFALGYTTPKVFNGSTWTAITAGVGQTVPPGAKHIAFHLGYIWVFNTNASTTALDGPSALRMSDPADPNSWPNANQTFISKDDGQVGMGLATYTIAEAGISPAATLIAFKNYSAYQIAGNLASTAVTIQKIKSDMGCVAPRSIQFCSGFGVIRLSHKGFALYNGVDDRLISEEVRPYIFGRDDITTLDWANIDRSWAAQAQNPPLYVCACPTSGSTLTRIFVYDLVRRSWSICDYPVPLQTMTLFSTLTTEPGIHAGTSTGGKVIALFSGATTDNGVAITWSFRTGGKFLSSPMRPTFWRRCVVDVLYSTTGQVIEAVFTLGGLPGSISGSKTLVSTVVGPLYGSATYGMSTYGATSNKDARQSFDINRTSPNLYADISGSGVVRVRGISFHAVQKPLTRVVA